MNNNNLREFLNIVTKGINSTVIVISIVSLVVITFVQPSLTVIGMFSVMLLVLFKTSNNYLRITQLLFDQ
jgi:hypothetical protein